MASQDDAAMQQVVRIIQQLYQASGSYVGALGSLTANSSQLNEQYANSIARLKEQNKIYTESSKAIKEFYDRVRYSETSLKNTIGALGGLKKRMDDLKLTDTQKALDSFTKSVKDSDDDLSKAVGDLNASLRDVKLPNFEKMLNISQFNDQLNTILTDPTKAFSQETKQLIAQLKDKFDISDSHSISEYDKMLYSVVSTLEQSNNKITYGNDHVIQSFIQLSGALGTTGPEIVYLSDALRKFYDAARKGTTADNNEDIEDALTSLKRKTYQTTHELQQANSEITKLLIERSGAYSSLFNDYLQKLTASSSKFNMGNWDKISTQLPKQIYDHLSLAGITFSKQFEDYQDIINLQNFKDAQNNLITSLAKTGNVIDKTSEDYPKIKTLIDDFISLGDILGDTSQEFKDLKQKLTDITTGNRADVVDSSLFEPLLAQQEAIISAFDSTNKQIQADSRSFKHTLKEEFIKQTGAFGVFINDVGGVIAAHRGGGGTGLPPTRSFEDAVNEFSANSQGLLHSIKGMYSSTSGYLTREADALANYVRTDWGTNLSLHLGEGDSQRLFGDSKQMWATMEGGQKEYSDWLRSHKDQLTDIFGSDSVLTVGIANTYKDVQRLTGMTDTQLNEMFRSVQKSSAATGANNKAMVDMTANIFKSNEMQDIMIRLDDKGRAAKIKEIRTIADHMTALGMSTDEVEKFTKSVVTAGSAMSPAEAAKNQSSLMILENYLTNFAQATKGQTGFKGEVEVDPEVRKMALEASRINAADRTEAQNQAIVMYTTALQQYQNKLTEATSASVRELSEAGNVNQRNALEAQSQTLQTIVSGVKTGMSKEQQQMFESLNSSAIRMQSKQNIMGEKPMGRTTFEDTQKKIEERAISREGKETWWEKTLAPTVAEISRFLSALKDSTFGAIVLSSTGALMGLTASAISAAVSLNVLAGGKGLTSILDWIKTKGASTGGAATAVIEAMKKIPDILKTGFTTILGSVSGIFSGSFGSWLRKIPDLLKTGLSTVFSSLPGIISSALGSLGAILSKLPSMIGTLATTLGGLLTKIPGLATGAIAGIGSLMSGIIPIITNPVFIGAAVTAMLAYAGYKLFNWVKNTKDDTTRIDNDAAVKRAEEVAKLQKETGDKTITAENLYDKFAEYGYLTKAEAKEYNDRERNVKNGNYSDDELEKMQEVMANNTEQLKKQGKSNKPEPETTKPVKETNTGYKVKPYKADIDKNETVQKTKVEPATTKVEVSLDQYKNDIADINEEFKSGMLDEKTYKNYLRSYSRLAGNEFDEKTLNEYTSKNKTTEYNKGDIDFKKTAVQFLDEALKVNTIKKAKGIAPNEPLDTETSGWHKDSKTGDWVNAPMAAELLRQQMSNTNTVQSNQQPTVVQPEPKLPTTTLTAPDTTIDLTKISELLETQTTNDSANTNSLVGKLLDVVNTLKDGNEQIKQWFELYQTTVPIMPNQLHTLKPEDNNKKPAGKV